MASISRDRVLDHDQFAFRTLEDPIEFKLRAGARIAVCLTVVLQRFHLDRKPPFAVPGMIDRPYPDIGNATQREVGLRRGFWRICEMIESTGLPTTFVVERDALPLLDGEDILKNARHDVFAGGINATRLHMTGLAVDEERAMIRDTRDALANALSRPIDGWRSPSCSQSDATLSLLAHEGFRYCGDFANDDRPYQLTMDGRTMTSVPMQHFSSDLHNLFVMRQPMELYFESLLRGAKWLLGRKSQPAIVLPIVVHPWITGVPHRIGALGNLLQGLLELDGVTGMNAREVGDAFRP